MAPLIPKKWTCRMRFESRRAVVAATVGLIFLVIGLAAPVAAQSLTVRGTVTEVLQDDNTAALGILPGDTFTFTFAFEPGLCNNSFDGCGKRTSATVVGLVGPVGVTMNFDSLECRAFPNDCGYSVDAFPSTVWFGLQHDLLRISTPGDGFITNSGVPVKVDFAAAAKGWFGPLPFPFPPTSIPVNLERDFFSMSSFSGPGFRITGRINCFVNCVPLTIRTTSLPTVTPGQPYLTHLKAVGGTGSYTWFVDGLPPGVYFTTAGEIYSTGNEGAPGGTYQAQIDLRDNGTGEIREVTLPLVVTGCSPWALTQQLVTLNYHGTGGPFTVVLGNGSPNECEYRIFSSGVYPGLMFSDAAGNGIGQGVVAPGTSRQLSAHVSSLLPNPFCAFRYPAITVFARDSVTHAVDSISLRAEWAPRPKVLLPNGASSCQPSTTIGPPKPSNYQPGKPGTQTGNSGVRG